MTKTLIRVIIVDDHAMVRKGLGFFLKGFEDLELVGEAASGPAAIALCAQTAPDVILMDMKLPGMDGAEAARLIRKHYPQVQVIALTSFQEEELVDRALQAGAIGFLLKNVSAPDLAQAIRQAHAGRPTLAPEATEMLLQIARQRGAKADYGLTKRERQVLALLAEGLSNASIAKRLSISESTVKYHVRGVLSKLGVNRRSEAASLAWKHDLVP
jgi:NarL family two-component system response regulator LiaR